MCLLRVNGDWSSVFPAAKLEHLPFQHKLAHPLSARTEVQASPLHQTSGTTHPHIALHRQAQRQKAECSEPNVIFRFIYVTQSVDCVEQCETAFSNAPDSAELQSEVLMTSARVVC